jgi:hypothetical protein
MRLVAGAACCLSGAALVIHILTGSPLWLVLTGLGFVFSLAVVAVTVGDTAGRLRLQALVKVGLVVGLIGTAVYDGARWLLVQVGGLELSPFEALPLFGQALLGEGDGLAVEVAGIGYHLLNGVAFGVAYVIWFGRRQWWWGVLFAFGLEAAMLAVYPGWLDPASIAELTQVSLVGHVAYGLAMGGAASWAVPRAMRSVDEAIAQQAHPGDHSNQGGHSNQSDNQSQRQNSQNSQNSQSEAGAASGERFHDG